MTLGFAFRPLDEADGSSRRWHCGGGIGILKLASKCDSIYDVGGIYGYCQHGAEPAVARRRAIMMAASLISSWLIIYSHAGGDAVLFDQWPSRDRLSAVNRGWGRRCRLSTSSRLMAWPTPRLAIAFIAGGTAYAYPQWRGAMAILARATTLAGKR